MTVTAPAPVYTIPPVYHRHVWRVGAIIQYDGEDDSVLIYAECKTPGCNAEMTKDEIETRLNGWLVARTLTDEN